METTKIDFSDRLAGLLVEKNITQKELAMNCGLSTQCVSALITGRNNPTGSTVITLAQFLGVSADYLLGLIDDFGTTTAAPAYNGLTSEERELLRLFRELSPYLKGMTLNAVRSWAKNDGDSERKKV